MIFFTNTNGHIWNRDKLIIDVITEILKNSEKIKISTNYEGPCLASLGLYSLLDQLCNCFNYDQKRIHIHTSNLIETHAYYNIIHCPQVRYLELSRQHLDSVVSASKHFNPNFKHFGHFIVNGNYARLQIASYLHSTYKDNTLQSYHCVPSDPLHKSYIALDNMMCHGATWQQIDQAILLLKSGPHLIGNKKIKAPIDVTDTYDITRFYSDFFVEIACMTYITGTTFHTDEKIWRPILMKTPFFVQGPQNYIKNLQKLGFKTFSNWWDEGYSEDPETYQLVGIQQNIDYLATKSIAELEGMYIEMQETLDHNFKLLFEINKEDFFKVQQ